MKPNRIVKITVEIFDDSDGVVELKAALRHYQEGLALYDKQDLYIKGPVVHGTNNMYTIDAKNISKK